LSLFLSMLLQQTRNNRSASFCNSWLYAQNEKLKKYIDLFHFLKEKLMSASILGDFPEKLIF